MNDIDENSPELWERKMINDLLLASIKEQRSSRRWRTFFRLALLTVVVVLLFFLFYGRTPSVTSHTALIKIRGILLDQSKANAEDIIQGLDAAFESASTKGIILEINSPGGSPVQSGVIYDEILRQRKLHPKIKVYAVCTDACASGAYYIAAAADEIYADKASIVGSIGVKMSSFGLVDAIEKAGVTRRLFTSGSEKDFLDMFLPLKANDVEHVQQMLDTVHQQFIDAVKKGRGDRLGSDPDLFSGIIWSGEQAVPLGLIDGLASPDEVARDIIKEENIIDFTYQGNILQRITSKTSASIASEMSNQISAFYRLG